VFWERKLECWANNIRNRNALPLRNDLWNGQQLNFGQDALQVVIRVPHVSALACLFKLSLANLGAAYVDGKIDVTGHPSAIIAIGNALATSTLKLEGKFARIVRSVRHSKEKDRDAIG